MHACVIMWRINGHVSDVHATRCVREMHGRVHMWYVCHSVLQCVRQYVAAISYYSDLQQCVAVV